MKKIDAKAVGYFLEGIIDEESAEVEAELGKYKKGDVNDLENKSNQIKLLKQKNAKRSSNRQRSLSGNYRKNVS